MENHLPLLPPLFFLSWNESAFVVWGWRGEREREKECSQWWWLNNLGGTWPHRENEWEKKLCTLCKSLELAADVVVLGKEERGLGGTICAIHPPLPAPPLCSILINDSAVHGSSGQELSPVNKENQYAFKDLVFHLDISHT